MANDPRDLDNAKLKQALLLLGKNSQLRSELVAWLKEAESKIDYNGSVRDDIIGPIVDSLHTQDDIYEKTLADGTRFMFLYRTKIARDFLLSKFEKPTHVWEPQTTRLLSYLAAKAGGDILIGGAYFGDHAVVLGCQLESSNKLVHCFEPNPDQASMLEKNIVLNHLHNVRVLRLGLWNESSKRLKFAGFDSFANTVVDEILGNIETITVDDYVFSKKREIGVLMLDVEGAELFALQGAQAVLKDSKPSIVFEVHRDYVDWSKGLKTTDICTLLSSHGYTIFAVRDFNANYEMGDSPIELIPVDSVYTEGPSHGFNMLAVSDVQLVKDPSFKIVNNVSPKLILHKSHDLHHPVDGLQIT